MFRRGVAIGERDRSSASFRARDIATGFAVRLGSHRSALILACLHPRKSFRKPLVLDNRGVRHALLLVEHAMRQSDAFPANLEPTIRILVGLDIFADQPGRQRRLVQNDPLAVVGKRQLLRDIALFPPGQNRIELSGRPLEVLPSQSAR